MGDFRADICKDKRSRDLVTVGPIFKKIILKVAQDSKEKKSASGGASSICVPEQSEKSWVKTNAQWVYPRTVNIMYTGMNF